MKFEKRGDGGVPEQTPDSAPSEQKNHGNKPVILYIMILFIVAFLLMAGSFIAHQRSNSEALGQLQNSVNAMQEAQSSQDKLIALQDKLVKNQDQIADLQKQIKEQEEDLSLSKQAQSALMGLYTLQQQYANHDLDACRATVAWMEKEDLPRLLPKESIREQTPASERYTELKDAVGVQ